MQTRSMQKKATARCRTVATKNIPNIDLDLEDYTMLYRMVKSGVNPKIKVVSTSKDLGTVPTFNTLAMIKGVEKPEEYVILSAHFDSVWYTFFI